MGLISIDGNILRKMMICGANNLTRHSQELDALNVFPVPDGDTGINMSNTVQAAAREAQKLNTPNIYEIAKAVSGGALRGARGNSGVILSQLFRGFAKGLEGKSVANGEELAVALEESAKMAYRAVMKPKEGTILTIAKAFGEYAQAAQETDIELGLREVIKGAYEVLEQTPEMLPELKQAGVVDSGGKGLIYFMEGALEGLLTTADPVVETAGSQSEAVISGGGAAAFSPEDIKFIYCTEFLIDTKEPIKASQEESLAKYLMSQGDSVVVVGDDTVVKVHVHTNHPGAALERGLTLGSLSNIKIDNMRLQHTNVLEFSTSQGGVAIPAAPVGPEKAVGFVAVVAGAGLAALFADLGADQIIEGGQTMNPSADDIVKAVSMVNAKQVVVLPNNKNIILAAEQAANLIEGKEIFVIPTKTVPQGMACLLDYLDNVDLEDYLADMDERIKDVHTGQVTYAVRDTVVKDLAISKGDILCLYDGEIVCTGKDIQEASKELIDYMLEAVNGEFASIYYGEDTTEEMAQELAGHITKSNENSGADMEVEIYDGKQPLYYYLISVE